MYYQLIKRKGYFMANELFNRYLTYAEKFGEEFAKKRNLEVEDVVQDARVYLLEYSESYNLDISNFPKYFRTSLNQYIKRNSAKYMVCGYPTHMSREINKLIDASNREMSFAGNIQYISDILQIPEDEAKKVFDCYTTIMRIEDKVSIDDVDEEAFAINDDYFVGYDVIDVINLINAFCNERETDIFIRITGLIGNRETAISIGQDYGISKVRVWQIYSAAREKLNCPQVKRALKQLLIATR